MFEVRSSKAVDDALAAGSEMHQHRVVSLDREPFATLCSRVRECSACAAMDRVHVLSEANGPLDADVLFVAEAPGRLGAARTGVPLTSDVSGRRFEAFLAVAGIPRTRCFVTNAVLCNPLTSAGNNRRPAAREVVACSGFLVEQLDLVRAPIVVAMGGVALHALGRIERHGLVLARDVARPVAWRGRTLVPLYHPGVRSTIARSHEQQVEDWRGLGAMERDDTSPPNLPSMSTPDSAPLLSAAGSTPAERDSASTVKCPRGAREAGVRSNQRDRGVRSTLIEHSPETERSITS